MNAMQDAFVKSYETLKLALAAAQELAETAGTARRRFLIARDQLLIGGELDGKNADVREAQLRQKLFPEWAEVEALEAAARNGKAAVEVARLDVEALRVQLRLMELETA